MRKILGPTMAGPAEGFRRMDNPSLEGSSLRRWNSGAGNVDVHYSSCIGNHFFYLLAEGSGAKTIGDIPHNSPTCNGSFVTGIGAAAAWSAVSVG